MVSEGTGPDSEANVRRTFVDETAASLPIGVLAEEFGVSSAALRGFARRRDLLPDRGRPGVPLRLAPAEVEALRAAWREERGRLEDGEAAEDEAPFAPAEAVLEGWRRALTVAEERAWAAESLGERLRAERDAAREETRTARHRAEEADRGRHAAEREADAVRAAAWQYLAALRAIPFWRRRVLPEPPPELRSQRRIEPPREQD